MPVLTPVLVLSTMALGSVAGLLGTLLGLGGGVFLVPFLVLVVGMPFQAAAAISLTTVIATSSAVSAATAGRRMINLRLGMLLEVATAAGGLLGGITAQMLAPATLRVLFAGIAVLAGAVTLARLRHSNVIVQARRGPGRAWGAISRRAARAHGDLPVQAAAAGAGGVVRGGQRVVLAGGGRRLHQGACAERVVRRSRCARPPRPAPS